MNIYSALRDRFEGVDGVSVLTAEQATDTFGSTTFSDPVPLAAAIKISQAEQISQVLTLANEQGFCVYPLSSAKNWGYGGIDTLKGAEKVVLDLSALTRIKMVDEALGLVSVQPGVTQGMLASFLSENNLPFMTPTTGAGPHCSILSNALETGYGITPYTDHFEAVTSLRGYLPHPDLCQREYRSSIAELDGSGEDFIDHTYKWSMGPYLDGIFVQSNLCVVSEATIRLAPKPEKFIAFYIRAKQTTEFAQLIQFIRTTLRDYAGIVGSINLMDKRRLLSMSAENPNGKHAHAAMTDEQVVRLAKENQTPEWLIVGTIYAKASVAKAVKSLIRKQARSLGNTLFSDDVLLQFARAVSNALPVGPLKGVQTQLTMLDKGAEIMQGIPNQVALPLAYWRNPHVDDLENRTLLPDKDKCGLMWYAPLIPMNANKIRAFVHMIREIAPQHGIEPLITFTNLKHDCIDATVPIVFNNEDAESRRKAHACLHELVQTGLKRGYVPYRLNTEQQQSLIDEHSVFWSTARKIKNSLDPNGILSPGRYIPF